MGRNPWDCPGTTRAPGTQRSRGPHGHGSWPQRALGVRPAAVAAGPARPRAVRWQPPPGRRRSSGGDVRAAILDVLATEPMNGYQIIQQIAERSGGAWKPSPGSVYPTVQQLEDEGLVEGTEDEARRLLQLTEAGRAYVEEHPDELAATWRAFDDAAEAERSDDTHDLKPVIGQVMSAVWQVVTTGTRQQQAEAAEILADTRRKLYGLLAEGDPE